MASVEIDPATGAPIVRDDSGAKHPLVPSGDNRVNEKTSNFTPNDSPAIPGGNTPSANASVMDSNANRNRDDITLIQDKKKVEETNSKIPAVVNVAELKTIQEVENVQKLNAIASVFKDSGMDTMQQLRTLDRVREILGW